MVLVSKILSLQQTQVTFLTAILELAVNLLCDSGCNSLEYRSYQLFMIALPKLDPKKSVLRS